MRRIVEAAFVLSLSVAATATIMAVVFPTHALGGAERSVESPPVQPAVFVEDLHQRPGTVDQTPACPFLAERAAGTRCPYLAALEAAASRCPGLSEREAAPSCPFLNEQRGQRPERDEGSVGHGGQHT